MVASKQLDRALLARLLRWQHDVITRPQAFSCGMTEKALRHRTRPDGPWRTLLHGIYLAQTGSPGTDQRDMAACPARDRLTRAARPMAPLAGALDAGGPARPGCGRCPRPPDSGGPAIALVAAARLGLLGPCPDEALRVRRAHMWPAEC